MNSHHNPENIIPDQMDTFIQVMGELVEILVIAELTDRLSSEDRNARIKKSFETVSRNLASALFVLDRHGLRAEWRQTLRDFALAEAAIPERVRERLIEAEIRLLKAGQN